MSDHAVASAIGPINDLAEFKRFLGKLAEHHTDEQLRILQRDMHIAAELLVDIFLETAAQRTTDRFDNSLRCD